MVKFRVWRNNDLRYGDFSSDIGFVLSKGEFVTENSWSRGGKVMGCGLSEVEELKKHRRVICNRAVECKSIVPGCPHSVPHVEQFNMAMEGCCDGFKCEGEDVECLVLSI